MHLRELTIICLKDKQKKAIIIAFSLHGSIFFPMLKHYVPKGIFPDWPDSVLRSYLWLTILHFIKMKEAQASFIPKNAKNLSQLPSL
mgnify:CR=1 FL=1